MARLPNKHGLAWTTSSEQFLVSSVERVRWLPNRSTTADPVRWTVSTRWQWLCPIRGVRGPIPDRQRDANL